MRGHFIGEDAGELLAVQVAVECEGVHTRWQVRPVPGGEPERVASDDPAIVRHLLRVRAAMHKAAARNRPPTPAPKPKPARRKKQIVAVSCPACGGGDRVFDCDVCQGAGIVRG